MLNRVKNILNISIINSILKLDDIGFGSINCEENCFWINPRYFEKNCKYGNWILQALN